MSKPEEEEVLFAYIAVVSHAVSLVLIRVDDGVQKLVYYVSKSLHEEEVRYLPLEKGESHFGNGACYTEAPLLLLSSYCCGSHPAFSSITALKG